MSDPLGKLVPPADRTLSDLVVRQLRKQIILGHLGPGERLGEVRLATQLGVSRSTVREALRRLEAESLIELSSHRGSKVARLDPCDAYEICELHVLLEAYAVRQALLPLSNEILGELERIVDAMAGLSLLDDVDRFIDLDHEFHRIVVRATGRQRLLQMWSSLSSLLGILVALTVRYLPDIGGVETAARHRVIIQALSQTDSAIAADAITAHYRSLESQIQTIVSSGKESRDGEE